MERHYRDKVTTNVKTEVNERKHLKAYGSVRGRIGVKTYLHVQGTTPKVEDAISGGGSVLTGKKKGVYQ